MVAVVVWGIWCLCVCACMHVPVCKCLCVCMCTCLPVCMCLCVCMCMWLPVCVRGASSHLGSYPGRVVSASHSLSPLHPPSRGRVQQLHATLRNNVQRIRCIPHRVNKLWACAAEGGSVGELASKLIS